MINNPPAMQETWLRSLGWEGTLEKGKATHSGILSWKIPIDRGPWWATVHGVAKSQTRLSDYAQHVTPLFLLWGLHWVLEMSEMCGSLWQGALWWVRKSRGVPVMVPLNKPRCGHFLALWPWASHTVPEPHFLIYMIWDVPTPSQLKDSVWGVGWLENIR